MSISHAQSKDTLNIPQQFDKIYRISTSYQEYKVISKNKYQTLKGNVLDSINRLKKEIQTKDLLISSQKDSISKSKNVISILSGDLNLTMAEKNSISFLGISMSKSSYSILVWLLIIILLISLLYFIYKFKSSNVITNEAKNNLLELEEEFASHKKKSLEKEQQLRRQLQDEINKQRGV
ncbi:MAG: hypothetical protein JXQ93_04765 [Flavobacteriaceae bacterium]